MVGLNVAARHGAPSVGTGMGMWAGFNGKIFVGSLALLQVAHQLLPEDHTDMVEVKVQQKMDCTCSSSQGGPTLPLC
jgi:hypothetical protein